MILIQIIVGTILFYFLRKWRKRMASKVPILSYEEAMEGKNEFCLYIRSFSDDGRFQDLPQSLFTIFTPSDSYSSITHEERAIGVFVRSKIRTIAVGMPSESTRPIGASRMYFKNFEWQYRVLELMKRASYILLVPANTDGLNWEIDQLVNLNFLNKTFISTRIGNLDNYPVRKARFTTFCTKIFSSYSIDIPKIKKLTEYIAFKEDGSVFLIPCYWNLNTIERRAKEQQ
jgi:hypothetical protein